MSFLATYGFGKRGITDVILAAIDVEIDEVDVDVTVDDVVIDVDIDEITTIVEVS
jgi:hypothetical protein